MSERLPQYYAFIRAAAEIAREPLPLGAVLFGKTDQHDPPDFCAVWPFSLVSITSKHD
jgi:hypothetical protein